MLIHPFVVSLVTDSELNKKKVLIPKVFTIEGVKSES